MKLNILPILLTIVANAIVLAAAVLMDWGPLRLLAVYWLEGVAIGIVTAVKIYRSRSIEPEELPVDIGGLQSEDLTPKISFLGMFIYYYGVALAATLFLIIIIFGLLQIPLPVIVEVRFRPLLWVILIALPFYIVHLVAYLLNFENKREYERVPASRQATRAFVRFSLVMVVTIIGSLISRALGMRILLLGIIILKTLIDIAAYLNENGKLGKNGQI